MEQFKDVNRRKSKPKEKLNIAMFGQKRIPSREGGVEIVVEELCTRMVAQGHNVTCYRKVESSMLHGYDRNMSNSIYHIYPILLKACKSKNMGGFVRQIQFEYVSAVVRLFLNETKNSEGYINMSRIIKKYLTDRLFQQSLEIVDARMYPVKFRIILYFLKHYDSFMSEIIIKLICLIRRQGINHA